MRGRVAQTLLIIGVVVVVVALGSLTQKQEPAQQAAPANTPVNETLERRNPSDDLPKPNTPQQWANDAAKSTVAAAEKGWDRGVKEGSRIYTAGNDPNLNLIEYAKCGDVEQMRLWLDRGADPNAPDPRSDGDLQTALMCAVRSGNPEAVRLLLPKMTEQGKKAQNRGEVTALTIARSQRNRASTMDEGERFHEIEQVLQRAGVPD